MFCLKESQTVFVYNVFPWFGPVDTPCYRPTCRVPCTSHDARCPWMELAQVALKRPGTSGEPWDSGIVWVKTWSQSLMFGWPPRSRTANCFSKSWWTAAWGVPLWWFRLRPQKVYRNYQRVVDSHLAFNGLASSSFCISCWRRSPSDLTPMRCFWPISRELQLQARDCNVKLDISTPKTVTAEKAEEEWSILH